MTTEEKLDQCYDTLRSIRCALEVVKLSDDAELRLLAGAAIGDIDQLLQGETHETLSAE